LINKSDSQMVWISEQAFMWLFFYLGFGELALRFVASLKEEKQVRRHLLPEEDTVVLTAKDLPSVYNRAKQSEQAYLPRLIQRIIRQFQTSHSASQANSVLDSSLELFLHEIDLKYNMLRYIMWVIPTLGFIGTVRGIALGLRTAAEQSRAGETDDLLYVVSADLSVAFHTTMLALIMSGILVLIMHICQGKEEGALNRSGQYSIDNLINRLYNPNK
ncbi:MAG: MotA/TolQ/ExbB proton channel family protein, partial [Akkermansiaceae bacterium]